MRCFYTIFTCDLESLYSMCRICSPDVFVLSAHICFILHCIIIMVKDLVIVVL